MAEHSKKGRPLTKHDFEKVLESVIRPDPEKQPESASASRKTSDRQRPDGSTGKRKS